jgi:deoxyribodipyrimidine photolyase-related protein
VDTVWVLGDQLTTDAPTFASRDPGSFRVLLVESRSKLGSRRWHRQRAHLFVTAMRRFAEQLRLAGHDVDYRVADTLTAGLRDHGAERVEVTQPRSWAGRNLAERLGVEQVRHELFLCHEDDFAAWAATRRQLVMEDFYRWQRRRLGYLMEGDGPAGGRWNFDADNRERPPRDGRSWPEPPPIELDALDEQVLRDLEDYDLAGASPANVTPTRRWPTSRAQAVDRLRWFVDEGLAPFGPHEDAMLGGEWKLAHSVLASSLNLGLLHPGEVCAAALDAHRRGTAPLNSVEGFVRQVIGWREYVWGLYWLWMPDYRHQNELGARRRLPPVFVGSSRTEMRCVANVVRKVDDHAWCHHIERLMVLGNLSLLAGVEPGEVNDWMWERFVDGAEWVMLPNVIGMALHADGGRMATKPYAGGGAYLNRMSDHCKGCRFDPKKRVGEDACPFTTLYWDFLARHRERFEANHRMKQIVANLDRLGDLDAVRRRAATVLAQLDGGTL